MIDRKSVLWDKVYGVLIGGAVGDALGAPVEAMHFRYIRRLYPGGINGLLPIQRPPRFFQPGQGAYTRSTEAGAYTDDTRLAQLIIQAIIRKRGRISADDLAAEWFTSMKTEYFWMSIAASYYKLAFSNIRARDAGMGNIPDNSSAMCIGPIGAVNLGDPRQAALDAYDIASLSHDGYSQESASVIAAAVAAAMAPNASVESVLDAALQTLPHRDTSPLTAALKRAIELAAKVPNTDVLTAHYYDELLRPFMQRGASPIADDDELSPSVDPLEAVPIALGMFAAGKGDYRTAVLGAANFGRDCDTIACMTGYICGAFGGASSIPTTWIQRVQQTQPEPDYPTLADGMTEAVLHEAGRARTRYLTIEAMKEQKANATSINIGTNA